MCFPCCGAKESTKAHTEITHNPKSQKTHSQTDNKITKTANTAIAEGATEDLKAMINWTKKAKAELDNQEFSQALTSLKHAVAYATKVYGSNHPDVKYAQGVLDAHMVPELANMTAMNVLEGLSNLQELKSFKPTIGTANTPMMFGDTQFIIVQH